MSAPPPVDVRDLFRVHRTTEGDAAALQGLTLKVDDGEVVVVLGPSGAGKSTLLRVLAGIEAPSAGQALVLGQDMARLSHARRAALRARRLGLVDQHHERALPAALDCRSAVGLPLALRGATTTERQRRADQLLERVGLADRGAARPHELSGGERQRVALCAALAHRPGLLLADEPGGELDATNAAQVYDLIADLAREERATVVLVSHDVTATRIADRSVRIRDGRVSDEAAQGGAEALVVGDGGWVRLPEELLRAARLGTRVHAAAHDGEIRLTPATPAELEAAGEPPEALTAPPPPGATASLRGVTKAFGSRNVLDAYDLTIAPGRLTALSGRSGSGKSTILRLLAGLDRPDAGSVEVAGSALHQLDREALAALRRRHVGVVSQDTGLLDHLAARENVALALTIRGVDHGSALELADHLLTDLGLAERTRQRTSRLSGGERQRVAIARALAPEPGLLLVDEPTSRLDEKNAIAVSDLLVQITRTRGTTIVAATHEPLLVERCDHVVRL